MNRDSFAIALTVKDEWDMLRFVLPYYKAKGAERIYLFFDGTSDKARDKAAALSYVEARDCVSISELRQVSNWVLALDPSAHMDHRKRINVVYAAERARQAGIGWIASLDPDEIVLPDPGQADLGAMLRAVPNTVDQVLVPNLELLPIATGTTNENVFASQRLFLCRQDQVAAMWRGLNWGLRRWLTPRQRAMLENGLYRLANLGRFPPVLSNPLNNAPIYRSLYLGYNNFKSFIRTDAAQEYNFNIHKWQKVTRSLKSVKMGRLLHYDLPSFEYFLKKFRQRPANMQLEVFDTRFQIGRISREASDEMARQFYEQCLCCINAKYAEKLVAARIAVWVNDVAESLGSIENIDAL